MKMSRLVIAALCLTWSAHAAAQDYPAKAVTVIVPFTPGGASDNVARMTTQKMQETFGQSFVIENKAGANGSIGASQLARSKPDGYTLMVGSIGVIAINPVLYKEPGYHPMKDFDLLSVAVRNPNVLITRPDFPASNVKEFTDYLKKNPDKVTFASSGVGSSDHLSAVLFWQKTGTTGIHTPYKGGSQAHTDLIGSHVDVSFQNLGAVANYIRSGKVKLLAVTSDTRSDTFPDTPTLKELGINDLNIYSWQAFVAPKGLPADVKSKLEKSITGALTSADLKKKLNDNGFEVVANSGAEFQGFLEKELDRWKTVVEVGKVKPEQ
ncbi:tripartite tricarboxylate transporter substrate binding protein [Tardiphaga alba]|uniref:Tripartite tricarboxylate transporter substrate binding protein n=1 Tax=Tardiphaga alba TaxID=340268 RepID=A0ABX8A6M5_9BRAD|nr:tripartite tricarboxylate transporter substrate binding protein [Tardiphaga alba]QUS39324.1 tripartite tricarboxylate transporter substrate binding protein [Tardiphaga alba]